MIRAIRSVLHPMQTLQLWVSSSTLGTWPSQYLLPTSATSAERLLVSYGQPPAASSSVIVHRESPGDDDSHVLRQAANSAPTDRQGTGSSSLSFMELDSLPSGHGPSGTPMVAPPTAVVERPEFSPIHASIRGVYGRLGPGWRIVSHDQTWSGQWGPQEVSQHINWKELMVIWKVTQLRHLQVSAISVYCDNMPTIVYIKKFGGTKSAPLLELARRIWISCVRRNTKILLTYVPSLFNPAGAPSRLLAQQVEWRMSRAYFHRLDQKWGPHQVDLFAQRNNHLLPCRVAWRPDPQAVAHDALQMSWQPLRRLYVCLPWNLLPVIFRRY
jgi:hypothetical protein